LALTLLPAPRFIDVSESFVSLARSPVAAGEGRGEEGFCGGRLRRPPQNPLFNPPSPLAARPGERGIKGGEGFIKASERRKCQP